MQIWFVCLSFAVGLQYDSIQKDLDGKVYTEGLHLGPVGYKFIKFPNIYTTMKFDKLQVWLIFLWK